MHPSAHREPWFWTWGPLTFPYVVSIIVLQSFAQTLRELGTQSEEIFRGDRLPSVPFPAPPHGSSPEPPPQPAAGDRDAEASSLQ